MFLAALFGDHPVGRPVIGSAQSVPVMTRAQSAMLTCGAIPGAMVNAAAGNVDHDGLGCVGSASTSRVPAGPGSRQLRRARVPAGSWQPLLTLLAVAEQTHVSLGIRTPGRGWEYR